MLMKIIFYHLSLKIRILLQIDRGGDVTYHGPGQLVGYPIIDLHDYRMSISWYMDFLSNTIIDMY